MSAPAATRMAWLDGLRAIAVLLVVYAHLSHYEFRAARAVTADWLNAGTAGVMLFFLVSGYIIPASLDRHGSPRRFWISRLFRLLPLYLLVCAVVLATGLAPELDGRAVLAHVMMLPLFLAVPLATPVLWTLSYEMAFYLLVTALFVLRLRRFDAPVAIGLAVLAVITAPLVSQGVQPVVTVAVVLVAGLIAVSSRRRWLEVTGGVLLGGTAVVLLALNQDQSHRWDGLLILAVMFTGTLIHRADHGRAPWWQVAVTGTVVSAALLVNWFAELRSLDALTPGYVARSLITLAVIGGVFALGMLTRRRRTPRPLAWIGLVSYSVYLVHYVLIQLSAPLLTRLGDHWAYGIAFVAAVLGISWLTYRWVELPAQRLGRRLSGPRPALPRPRRPHEDHRDTDTAASVKLS
jgi:peptidoglycan/LPS O-acetylase OafA/YrhL